jgi:hypothetical protein
MRPAAFRRLFLYPFGQLDMLRGKRTKTVSAVGKNAAGLCCRALKHNCRKKNDPFFAADKSVYHLLLKNHLKYSC